MPAGKTFPRNAAGRVRKYFEHFVYNLHFLSCVGTPVSECSSTSHRGIKAFLASPLSRLITKNKSVFIFYGYIIDKKTNVAIPNSSRVVNYWLANHHHSA